MMEPLQGRVSFDAIIAKPEYQQAPVDVQRDVALRYFEDHYASKPEYQQAPVDVQNDARQRFFQDYNIPDPVKLKQPGRNTAPVQEMKFAGQTFDQLPFFNPKPGAPDQASAYWNAANMAAGSVLAPANDLINPFWRNAQEQYAEKYRKAYPGIENDQGFLGNAYRLHQNKYANMVGQGLAAYGAIRQLGANMTGQAAGRLPFLGKLGQSTLQNLEATGAFEALTNAADVFHGKQNPLQALGNAALNTATAGFSGKTRLGNALTQGAGGFISGGGSSILDDITHGRAPDLNRAWNAAQEGGAIGLGMGAAFHHNEKTIQGKVQKTAESPTEAPPAQPQRTPQEWAQDIHAGQTSSDPRLRIAAKARLDHFKAMAKDKRSNVNPARIRKEGDSFAKEVLVQLELHKEAMATQKRAAKAPRQIAGKPNAQAQYAKLEQTAIEYLTGKRSRPGAGKQEWANDLKKYFDKANLSKQDRDLIYARARDVLEKGKNRAATLKAQQQKKSAEAIQAHAQEVRNRHLAEREKQQAAKKAAQEEVRRLQAEAKTANAEKQRQLQIEIKLAEKRANAPDILNLGEVEAKASELFGHHQANEKGQLEAKLSYHKKIAKSDLTKHGLTKEEGAAINKSHQQVLDRYAQKQAEQVGKPSIAAMKAGQEVNRLELAKLNERGGKYTPGDHTALQGYASTYTLEELKSTKEWENIDPETRRKAEIAAEAAKADSKVIMEYDAEKSGDTGQFKLKTVSPLGFDIYGTPENPQLVMRAVNENGHDHTYYLSPSAANKETGFISVTHDIHHLSEFQGKAKRGLEGSAYHGQRDVKSKEILSRPKAETAGYTHELEAKVKGADRRGEDVHAIMKSVNRNARKAKNATSTKAGDIATRLAKSAESVENIVEIQPDGHVGNTEFDDLSKQMQNLSESGRKKVANDTGCLPP